jgi:hypothetical protein
MQDKVIIGGDLNFTLSRSKVWGFNARRGGFVEFFKYKIEGASLVGCGAH